MKKGMSLYTLYTSTVGIAAIMLAVLYICGRMDAEKTLLILEGIVIACLPITLLNRNMFKPGLGKAELWLRRIISVALGITICGVCFTIVGFVENTDMFLRIIVGGFTVGILISLPLCIIMDRRTKKNIEQINKKLQEQNEEEQTESDVKNEDWH